MVNKTLLVCLAWLAVVPVWAQEPTEPIPTGPVARPRRPGSPGVANSDQGVGGNETTDGVAAGALPPVAPPGEPKAAGDGKRKALFFVRDPNSTMRYDSRSGALVARGKMMMVMPDDEVIILADAVDYTGDEEGIATLTGNLKLLNGPLQMASGLHAVPQPENTLTGVIAYVFTKEKRAVVDQEVVLVHTPKDVAPPDADEAEQAKHDETTLYCDRLTYWYRKGARRAFAQPRLPSTQIKFVQKTRHGNAGNARFYDFEDGESETGDVLDLFGGVYGEDDKGQLIEAENARLYIDQDNSEWYNLKRAVVNLDEEEATTPPAEPEGLPARPGETPPSTAPAAPPAAEPTTPPAEPAPTEPAPTKPAPTEPAPTEPAPATPAPTEPAAGGG